MNLAGPRRAFFRSLLFAGAVAIAAASSFAAETRTFTDNTGRKIEAEIVDVTESDVQLRRNDGQIFEIPIAVLAPADRDFVDAWRFKRAFAMGGLEISAHRVLVGAARTETGSTRKSDEKWRFTITVANKSRLNLEGLAIEYRVFYVDDKPGLDEDELPLKRIKGSTKIAGLATGAEASVETSVVKLQITRSNSGPPDKRKVEDSLKGIWVRVLHGRTVLQEFSNPSKLATTQVW